MYAHLRTVDRPGRREIAALGLGAGAVAAGLLGLLVLGSSCSAGRAQESAPPPAIGAHPEITVVQVGEQEIGKFVITSARVGFDENSLAHIFSPVTGRVTRIVAQLGEKVKKGQVLAVITSPDMGSAMSDVDKARPALVAADRELKREQELVAEHADTQQNLDAAQATYDQAVAEMNRASEKLRLLQAQAHMNRVSQDFPLVSPIDGEVLARQINPGVEVQGQYSGGTQLELYTIGKQDRLWIFADLYEQDLSRVKVGAPVQVTTVAYPDKTFTGTVDWISGMVDPTSRTVSVRCTLENPNHLLKSQMYATVKIQAEGRMALAVPRDAVLHFGDKQMVIAVEGADHYVRRPVIVDEDETGDFVPVLHGLQPGDKVVTHGAILLSEALN